MTVINASQIAQLFNLSTEELFEEALVSLLREKKREVLQARLELLTRYGVASLVELTDRIAVAEIAEHPAWEDSITLENLEARLEELNGYLADLQRA